jgi:NADPH-dependent glutamate synthase beta subunit-like oxidoreductase
MSCHCGSWLKPLAQRDTYEIRKVNGPEPRIMAAGGITSAEDAIQMIMCGADLLGVCAETLISGFDIVRPMISGMKQWMDQHGYATTREFRDAIVSEVKTAPELTLYGGHAQIKDPYLAAPCKDACPHHVPAQAYVRKVAKKEFRRAYELITRKDPLQQTCGYVCSHPCEDACTRGENGQPIRIRDIKRFVLEYGKAQGWAPVVDMQPKNGIKAAVVGSGPAGISNAFYLAQAGYDVTIFEKEEKTGGMLRYALPSFRMAKELIDDEMEKLARMGVAIETGKALDRDFTINSLKEQGYRAVFLGVGAQKGRALGIDGEQSAGVISAVDFLKQVSIGEKPGIGQTVVVIGGGFTAVDSARTAKRLGAKDVYIAYRRTKEEMPATAEEIAEAEAEGIRIMYLVAPVNIAAKDGKVTGIRMRNQVLGETDSGGRRTPEAVETAEFTLACDTVVAAIGQQTEPVEGVVGDGYAIRVQADTLKVCDGVYAGGDAVEVKTIIAAVAAGKKAAVSMDKAMRGHDAVLEYEPAGGVVDKDTVLKRTGYFKDDAPISLETVSGKDRAQNFAPYTRTMTEEEAVAEASRCLACGCGEGCGICASICSEFTIDVDGYDKIRIDDSGCVACGMCFNRCPNDNIEMVSTGQTV